MPVSSTSTNRPCRRSSFSTSLPKSVGAFLKRRFTWTSSNRSRHSKKEGKQQQQPQQEPLAPNSNSSTSSSSTKKVHFDGTSYAMIVHPCRLQDYENIPDGDLWYNIDELNQYVAKDILLLQQQQLKEQMDKQQGHEDANNQQNDNSKQQEQEVENKDQKDNSENQVDKKNEDANKDAYICRRGLECYLPQNHRRMAIAQQHARNVVHKYRFIKAAAIRDRNFQQRQSKYHRNENNSEEAIEKSRQEMMEDVLEALCKYSSKLTRQAHKQALVDAQQDQVEAKESYKT